MVGVGCPLAMVVSITMVTMAITMMTIPMAIVSMVSVAMVAVVSMAIVTMPWFSISNSIWSSISNSSRVSSRVCSGQGGKGKESHSFHHDDLFSFSPSLSPCT